ncbi:hypothetical protein BGX28_002135, partial [Mortierella sp. GBA30]
MVTTRKNKAIHANGEHLDSSPHVNNEQDDDTSLGKKQRLNPKHEILSGQDANGKRIIRLCANPIPAASVTDDDNHEMNIDDETGKTQDEAESEPELEFQVIRRTRERFNRVLVDMKRLPGEETNEKRACLLEVLNSAEVKILAGPKPIKIQEVPFYSVAVETEEDVQKLLAAEYKNADNTVVPLFVRANDEWRQDRLRRSVE